MKILPFNGYVYDVKKVNVGDVVTLPYDKISAEKRAEYQKRSLYNMVHLILPETHEASAKALNKWIEEKILFKDAVPAIYVYEQEYEYFKGQRKTRRGFIALLEVKPFGKDTIMPHEKTFSKVVEDRMHLLGTTKANIEQIFILHTGGDINKLLDGKPEIEFKDEFDIIHRMWRITDPQRISEIQKKIDKSQLFIADGHHRYTASLMYKEKMQGDDYIMATFVSADDAGLTILPTHRVLKNVHNLNEIDLIEKLKKYFDVFKGEKKSSDSEHSFGICFKGGNYYTAVLKSDVKLERILNADHSPVWMYLDVNILHLLIMKEIMGIETAHMADSGNISYIREKEEAVDMVKKGMADIAFILNPTKVKEVKDIVDINEVMPHKSTDFYPKLHSGLVLRKF